MPRIPCPFGDCGDVTENDDKEIAIAVFNAHVATHTLMARAPDRNDQTKVERLQRPKVSQGMLEETWN